MPSRLPSILRSSVERAYEATEKDDGNEQRRNSEGLHDDARLFSVPISMNGSTAGLKQSVDNVLPSAQHYQLPTVAAVVSLAPSLRTLTIGSGNSDPQSTRQLDLWELRAVRSASPGSAPNQLPSISLGLKSDDPEPSASGSAREGHHPSRRFLMPG